MTPRERFFARLKGEPVDKIPNMCIIMGFGAKYIDSSLKDYLQDHNTLVEANVKCAKDFGLDILQAISDPLREAEGFGAEVTFPDNEQPHCSKHLLDSMQDAADLVVPNPYENARMLDRILAVKKMKQEHGQQYPVMGWVEGPFAEIADLRGVSEMMMDIFDYPQQVMELAEKCLETAISFARAQVEAGADIIGVGDAVVSLLGPAIYSEYIFDLHKRLFDAIEQMGAVGRLHICGDISALLEMLADTGAQIVDLDHMVDIHRATQIFGDRVCCCGNFDPVSVLLNSTPETIERVVTDIANTTNERCFVMAGCEVPINTPVENLRAVDTALRKLT